MADSPALIDAFAEFRQPGKLDVIIFGLVGGPGSGKGTQCTRLAEDLPLVHLSVGDVLREEMAIDSSPYAELIRNNMQAGRVGPPELTVGLLRRHMEVAIKKGTRAFILDGFPRNTTQCRFLEDRIAPVQRMIVLECSDATLRKRLGSAQRQRFDDNDDEIISRRIRTFRETTSHVIAAFEASGRVASIDGEQSIEIVASHLRTLVQGVLAEQGLVAVDDGSDVTALDDAVDASETKAG